MSKLVAVSLFSGIGGVDLAAEWAGFTHEAFCEADSFCRSRLSLHWPDVKIFPDVKSLPQSRLPPRIHLLHGGYPCQPFSVAGSQKGQDDERHLWPYMRDIIIGKRPDWVLAENVKGHVTLGLDEVLDDLERLGYASWAVVLPAIAVGAPHTRERVFVIANTTSHGRDGGQGAGSAGATDECRTERPDEVECAERCRRLRAGMEWESRAAWGGGTEPFIRQVDDGLPEKLVRQRALKAYGNAVVPLQVYPILALIADCLRDAERITT